MVRYRTLFSIACLRSGLPFGLVRDADRESRRAHRCRLLARPRGRQNVRRSAPANRARAARMKTAVKIVAATCFALANYSATAVQDMTGDCRIGIYHLRDGSDVDIGQGKDSHLRLRRKDGTSGELTETTDGTWTST